MAYDDELAQRVRELISVREAVSEREMFGSNCFLVGGNLALCVREDELLVRLDPEVADEAATEDGVRAADMAGREMKGWVFVSGEVISDDAALAEWVDAGADRAASLPAKE